eukprot:TRINITY_DN13562_c0_g2_i3.p1 TRINITY_DN13562_c0_g2~~TRINITY_DN13562_c0_g2_i3.p1  ORF type:complete len:1004 (+),score=184.11 TRINITY_DN13562_c0_g2_i3:347-3358(+)
MRMPIAAAPCCTKRASRTAMLRHMLIILFLFMGFGAAMYVGWQRHHGEQKGRESQLTQWCGERSSMLELEIITNANHVKVFTAFVEEFKPELMQDSSRFQRFMDSTAYARPSVYGVYWSMVVADKDRSAYEAYWNTTINDKSTGASEDRRATYYPITLVSSTLASLRFLDKRTISLSDNSWEAALTGELVITPPYSVPDRPFMRREIIMCWPTFRQRLLENATSAERVEAVDGLITAVFFFHALVERFLSRWATSQPFTFDVYDVTNRVSPAVLYAHEREVASNAGKERSHLKHVMAMNLGDPSRSHEMWCWYKKRSISRSSIIWGMSVVVVVVLIACVLLAAIHRMEVAEENYVKMEKLKTEAEVADRAKSTFLATMSHELRTPMNGVLGMLNILKETNLDAEQAEYAQTASSCANSLITLVNDILDLAKVESGHMDLERTQFDIRVICGQVLDIFQEEARKKNVELATLVAPDVPPLLVGDPHRLRQVFINFVGNALKFTREGHVFVRISVAKPMCFSRNNSSIFSPPSPSSLRTSLESSAASGRFGTLSGRKAADESNSWETLARDSAQVLLGPVWHASLAVKGERRERQSKVLLQFSCEDTGVGIPEAVQHQIFNPFIQADSSTTRKYGGTGIGLHICQKLIGMMGSEIKVVSEMGVGSTFYFTLEMDAEARPAGDSEGDRATNASEEQVCRFPRLKGCRALVIAPRLMRRLVLVDALQALGMEVAVVDDIKEATAMIFQDVLQLEGEKSPEIGRRNASGASVGDRAFECIVLDVDDWDSDSVIDFAERVRVDSGRRGQVAGCMPVVLVAACSFTAEMEERISRIPCATKLHKPISSRNCGVAIMKALGSSRGTPHLEKAERAQTKESSNSGIHVLVVDDNLVNQKVACKLLERICVNSTVVGSAASAIAVLAEGHPFDAVFMDVQMPDMDGIEATEILRAKGVKSKNPLRGLIPIFAMTADATKEMEAQCSKAGMDCFVPKPMDPGKLFDIMAPFFPS